MQRAVGACAFRVVAAAAQGLEALREAVLDQPGPEGRATRVRAAEQFDAVGAAIAVDVVDGQVLGSAAASAGPAVVVEDFGAEPRIPAAFRFPALQEIRLGPTVYTCSSALGLRARRSPGVPVPGRVAVCILARQRLCGETLTGVGLAGDRAGTAAWPALSAITSWD